MFILDLGMLADFHVGGHSLCGCGVIQNDYN